MEKNFLFKFRKLLNSIQHRVFTRGPRNTEEQNNSPCISVLSVFFVVKRYTRKLRFFIYFCLFFSLSSNNFLTFATL